MALNPAKAEAGMTPAEKAVAMLASLKPSGGTFNEPVVKPGREDESITEHITPIPLPTVTFVQPHRVSVVDIDEIGNWLIGRLRERFPQHSDRMLFSWLRGCTNDNECLFLRAAGAVMMATVHRSFLTPPWIEEVFCLAVTEEDKLHACGLYTDVRTWALGLNATKIICEQFTDVDRADISLEIGTPKREVRSVVYLPQQAPRAA